MRREFQDKPTSKIVLDFSTTHEDFPETPDTHVRAITVGRRHSKEQMYSGLKMLERTDPKTGAKWTKYVTISHIDFAGVIPAMVINMVAGSAPISWFGALQASCAKHAASLPTPPHIANPQ